jgi:hypothetical protein
MKYRKGLMRGARHVGQCSGHTANGQRVFDAATVRSAIRQGATCRLGKSGDTARQSRFSHVDDRSATHLSVDDVLSLLTGGSPCHTEVGECMRLVQPENTARGRACYCGRTGYPYRNVIPFGVTGMSVKATERAGEYERMKFIPLVEKKRVCRHVGHSTRGGPLYPEIANAGPRGCFQN